MSKLLTEYNNLLEQLITRSKDLDVYMVARIQQNKYFSVLYKNSQLDKVSLSSDKGIGIYAFTTSGHLAFASTNDLTDEESVIKVLENAAKIAHKNEEISFDKAPEIFKLAKQENLGEDHIHYLTNSVTNINIDKLKSLFMQLEEYLKKCNSNIKVMFRVIVNDEQWRIVRSDTTDVDFSIPKVRLIINLALKEGDKTSSIGFNYITTTLDKIFEVENVTTKLNETDAGETAEEFLNIKKIIKNKINHLEKQLDAESITPGHYPLLIDSDLCGMLTHEAFGHACESDAVAEDGSVLRAKNGTFKTGEQVASVGVNIYDYEEGAAHGFHPYGAFGNLRQKVQLVENGILKDSISDVFTAEKINVPQKNTERSESYSSIAIPRMSNTYLEIDESKYIKVQDIDKYELSKIEDIQTVSIESGLLDKYPKLLVLMKMMGGQVETKQGDFMFGVGFVYEITKDKITPYKPCSFSGKVLEALKSIQGAIGDVKKDVAGFCGKSGQTVCVNTGGNQLVLFNESNFVNIS